MTDYTKPLITTDEIVDRLNRGYLVEGYTIDDCTIMNVIQNRDVKFIGCDIGRLVFVNTSLVTIQLIDCSILRELEIVDEPNPISLLLINNRYSNSIRIRQSWLSSLSIISGQPINSITITENTINSNRSALRFENVQLKKLHIKELSISNFEIINTSIQNVSCISTNIQSVIIKSTYTSEEQPTSDLFCVFEEFSLDGQELDFFEVSHASFTTINLHYARVQTVRLNQIIFSNSLDLKSSNTVNELAITNSEINTYCGSVQINKRNESAENIIVNLLRVNSTNLQRIILKGVSQVNRLQISNCAIEREFDISSTKLISLSLHVVRLKNAILKIHNTTFPETMTLKNVEWSTQNRAYEFHDLTASTNVDSIIYLLNTAKESYRVLKVHFLVQHNYFDAMLFSTNEIRIEKRIKEIETWNYFFQDKGKVISFKSFRNNFGDWFVLWTNLHFSNYGLSWIRPLSWMFTFMLIFLYLVLTTFELGIKPIFQLSYCHLPFAIETTSYDCEATKEGFKIFLRLLSPVHDSKMDVLNIEKDIWGFWDFTARIFSSYFIFLTIRGTRKFNFKVG